MSQTGQPLPCADLWLGNAKAIYRSCSRRRLSSSAAVALPGKRCNGRQPARAGKEYWVSTILKVVWTRRWDFGRKWRGWRLHPAEKRKPWCVRSARLAELAWQRWSRSEDTAGGNAAGAPYPQLSAGAGQCSWAMVWWCV
ncbi:hypothetical protein KCP69_11360 [Salmonella enterica subsp. enterica]|nr:hypothetical protein KCP69_11360 [Salmonella enterica subsp. enterica]